VTSPLESPHCARNQWKLQKSQFPLRVLCSESYLKVNNKLKARSLFSCYQKEQGFSLIEVMLVTLILSFGLMGFVQGQLMALRVSEYAYFINLADLKNNDLVERIQSCANKLACIQAQLIVWQKGVAKLFPQAEQSLTKEGSDYQSKITWLSIYPLPKIRSLYLLFRA
jgi:prepilin-type N-terminal cleavage/methylation domain-containing protein